MHLGYITCVISTITVETCTLHISYCSDVSNEGDPTTLAACTQRIIFSIAFMTRFHPWTIPSIFMWCL